MPTSDSDASHPHVAVTGAAGYLGSRVVSQLQRDHPDWTVTALDNFYLGDVREVGGVAVEHVDVRDRDRLEDALAGADAVLHLAAVSGVDDCEAQPDLGYETNVVGTNHVAWFCRKTGAALAFPLSMAMLGDPQEFPITVEHPRDPMNWYGRTKLLGERAVETYAEDAFPAHQCMVSNLYGEHDVGGTTVSKRTVINIFVEQALAGGPLTVHEPGTQARNYVHVADVADAFVNSAERLIAQRENGITGVESFEIASDEDPDVTTVAEWVADAAAEKRDIDAEVRLVENPRDNETLVDRFAVDTTAARERLGWTAECTVRETIRDLVRESD